MTDSQENVLTMGKTCQKVLTDNPTIVATPVAFATGGTDLDNHLDYIDGLVQVQLKIITGKRVSKESTGDDAIAAAMLLIGPAQSYALAVDDNDFYATINYTDWQLREMRDTLLRDTLLVIRDAIQAKLAALADYGITAAMISALTSAIGVYELLIGAPRAAIATRAAATKALVPAFQALNKILERLDGFVMAKKASHLAFYNAWFTARKIVNN